MSFADFARSHGVLIGDMSPSPRIQRVPTVEHERSKNGAAFWDGRRGWVMAWDGDGRVHWFDAPEQPWTDAEKREWAAQRRAAAARKEAANAQAARTAAELLKACRLKEHGYLIRKGLRDSMGLVHEDGTLLVPMRDARSNALLGVQSITWDGEALKWVKKMLHGMRAKGAVLRIGPTHSPLWILCEGYATGLSIAAAAQQMRLAAGVVVCFSDSNLMHVAEQLKGRLVVFADNDKSGAGQRAAEATGLPFCMSPEVGEDANDLHARAGLMAVCGLLLKLNTQARRYVVNTA